MRKLMFAAAMLLSFAALSWGQAYVPVTTWYDSKPGAIDFTINSADELAGLAQLVNGTSSVSFEGKTITLGKDIELNDPTDWEDWDENTNDLKQWVPIGGDGKEFKGKFNGNGKVISGLYVNSTSSYQGLFGNVNQGLGSISNLGLVSFYVQGSSKVGGIIGGGGSVINSYAIGNVTLQATFYSYNEGVGGISGHGGNVKNSYFVGKVTGTGDNVGSIVGEYNVFSSERVINSFYNSDFETVTNPFGTPKTTAQMKDGSLYKALNMYARMQNTYNRGNYMDWENNADDYPSFSDQEADYIYMENYFNDGEGTSASPYLIKNKDQLEDLAMLTNAGMNFENTYFKLDADIPLNKTPWTPIGGGSSNAFKGHFDGNGKVISGLYINSTDDYQGLFGYVGWETNISNLGLVDCYVKGNNNVGCISGHDGRIWNSYAIGEVTGVDYVGGMVGNGGRATNSYYVGKIEGTGSNVGIIGDNGDVTHSFYNLDSATVKNSLGTPKTTKEMQSTAFRDLLQIYAGIANQSPYGNDFGWIYNEDGYPSHFSAKAEKVFGVPFLANHDGMLWAPDMELQVQTPGLLKCLLDTPDECDGISIWKTSNVRGSVQITTPIATSGMEVKLETIAAAVDVYNNAKIAFDFQPGAALQDIKNGGGYCISYSSSMPVELALNWMDEFYSDNYYYYTLPKGDNTLNIPWSSFNRDGYEGGEKDNALKEATGLMIRLRSGSNTAASPVKIANFTLKKLGWFGGCGIGYAANTAWYTKDTLAVSFIINTAEELAGLAMLVNNGTQLFNGKTITLGQDIVLNDTNSNSGWQNWATNDGTDLKQWIPIGNGEYQFEGYFNGNGKEISGLYINSSDDYQGLFGYIRYGEVSNLGLVGFYVKGKHAVGGIIGDAWFRSVVNSYAIGNVSSTESSVDGIIGISGSVKNSYFVGKVNNDAKFLYYDNWGDDKSKTLTEMQFIDFRNLLQERAVELNEENANNNYLGWQHNPNGYPSHSGTNAVGNILSIQGDATNNNGAKVCISDNCGKQLGNILDYYMLNSQNNRLELSPNSSSCAMNGNNLVCYGGITLIDYYSGTTGAVNGVHHRAPYTGLSGYYEIYAEIKPVNQGTYLGAEPIKISAFTAGANTQAVWGNISGDDGKFIYNLGAKAKETTSGKLVPIGFASGSWDCPDLNRYGTQNCEFTVYLASATEGGSYGQLVNISVSGDSGLRFFTDSLGLNEVVDYQTFIIPSSKSAGPFPGLLVLWVTSDEAGTYTINDEHQVTVYKNITEGQEPFLPQTFSATYQDGLTLGGITPPLNYSWLEPNTLVYAGSGQEFDATYGPVNYTEPGVGKLTLNVAKASAAPTFVQTNSVNVQYKDGLTLASIPLPNGYEWQSPTTSISTTQVQTFDAWYTDTNYANRASGEITINVFKGDGTVTITGWTYGQESNEPVTNTTTNGAVTIKYTGSEYSGKSYESVNPPDSAGKYQVIATFAAKGDYGQVVASQNFVISKAQGNGSVSIDGRKFGAEANEPVVESETNGKDNVTY
ncbi:MAG: hypothetical protein FWC26_06110, partial [Fibromonadales bacterium]|nr:hypothetical protein [Fibromonadales bacterium]